LLINEQSYAQAPGGRPADEGEKVNKPVSSGKTPSLPKGGTFDTSAYALLSSDSLDGPVFAKAIDSMHSDIINQVVYLWGNAEVRYQDMILNAAYIKFDLASNELFAEGLIDSTGQKAGLPHFKQGDYDFKVKQLKYNFKNQQGKVYGGRTVEDDVHLLTEEAKFITGESTNYIYGKRALITTCDADHPHFGIRSTRQKIIPNKLIVTGPANLQIADVPLPIWLPFGFFPITKGGRSGLLFPRDYEFSPEWGFGLRNLGYHFHINDYVTTSLTGDLFTRGSWGMNSSTQYRKRYKFNGNVRMGFSIRQTDEPGTPDFRKSRSFYLNLNHNQDPKAHPYRRLGGNINFQTNNYLSLNQNDANSVQTNTLSSGLTYSRLFPGRPINFSMSLSHSQNTLTRDVTFQLPIVNFSVNRIFPFKHKEAIGNKERWYEKIGIAYTAQASNRIRTTDTTIFTRQTLESAEFGVRHTVPINANFKLFKYFNFAPSINYTESWYFKTEQRDFDPSLVITPPDTIYTNTNPPDIVRITPADTIFGSVNTRTANGFKALRQYNVGASLSTKLFGMLQMKRGYLRALRHVMTPTVSFSYRPDFGAPSFGYYKEVPTNTLTDETQTYSIFNGAFGTASRGKSSSISFNINNRIEGKVFNKKDTTGALKKIKVIENLSLNTSYNMAADSLRWAPLNISAYTQLFGFVRFNFSTSYDFYAINTSNQRLNQFFWKTSKKPLRFNSANLTLSTSLNNNSLSKLFGIKTADNKSNQNSNQANGRLNNRPSLGRNAGGVPKGFNLTMNYSLRAVRNYVNEVDTFRITTNNLSMSGNFSLTPKWRFGIGRVGYDFTTKRVTYPDLSFYRDLHCWEMGMNWQPERQTYSFFLRVKPGTLDFVNVPYRKANYDPLNGF